MSGSKGGIHASTIPQSFIKCLPCARDVSVDKINCPQRTSRLS